MSWVRTIAPEDADGRLAEAYGWQAERLGRPTDFTLLGSLEPEIVYARLALYKASEQTSSRLTARQKNVASHVVSSINQSPHCASRSRIKLRELGFADAEIAAIERGELDDLPPEEAAVGHHAALLTTSPGLASEADVEALRAVGLGDHEIVDLNNQIAHLNYTNRVANGLGLLDEVEADYPAFATVPR